MPRARLVPTSSSNLRTARCLTEYLKKPESLPAYYSKNRGNDKVEIDYIEKKHVKKVNGARPGFVILYTPTIRWSSTQTSQD